MAKGSHARFLVSSAVPERAAGSAPYQQSIPYHHGCLFHIDIKNGEIWIQHDGTEEGIAYRLVERGVPKTDIVLAFHAPFRRQFTGFASE